MLAKPDVYWNLDEVTKAVATRVRILNEKREYLRKFVGRFVRKRKTVPYHVIIYRMKRYARNHQFRWSADGTFLKEKVT